MSQVILGWQLTRRLETQDIAAMVSRIKARYQPLFEAPIHHAGICHENQGLLHFDVLPREAPWVHVDTARIICVNGGPSITVDTPSTPARRPGAKELYDLMHDSSGRLDRQPISRINPPFTLCWFDRQRRELGLAHDGLGGDQFFIAETAAGMVFSNKCWPILQFLGEAPRLDHRAWQYWFCLGWFPGNSTPFENVRHLDRGEFVHADSRTVSYRSEDTLAAWLRPVEEGVPASLMTRAVDSVQHLIRLHRPTNGGYGADLTGGLDSRAICSVLIKEAMPCSFSTGGPRFSSDVMVARKIARRFHLDWVHLKDPPFWRHPGLPQAVDLQFSKLLLWGEGLVQPSRFQHFQVEPHASESGGYLSGGASEISKGYYYAYQLGPADGKGFDCARALLRLDTIRAGPLCDTDRRQLSQLLRDQVAKGAVYGLREVALLDYFYLTERIRRWQSAHIAINLFDRSVLPFLSIDHIRLAFAMSPLDKAEHRFQKRIIASNVEKLLEVPFGDSPRYRLQDRLLDWRPKTRWLGGMLQTLDWADYLRADGRLQLERILASDTPLWEILDRDKTVAQWDGFLRGSNRNLLFPLSLMAFWHWYAMYFEAPPGQAPRVP